MDSRTQERYYEEAMGKEALKSQKAATQREKICTCTATPKWRKDGHADWCPAAGVR